MSDVSDVKDSVEDIRTAGLANGKPAVLIIIFRQPGANIIETVDRVQGDPAASSGLDSAVDHTSAIVMDRTTTIRASVSRRREARC